MGETFRHFDKIIILPALVLMGFSLVVIGSINPELFRQQALFFLFGSIIFLLLSFIDYRTLRSLGWLAYGLSILLLIMSFFGPNVRGATRWIEVIGFRLQPSELIKPLLIVSQAMFFASYPPTSVRKIVFSVVIFLLPPLLVFKQPDLGNSIILIGTLVGLLFFAGISLSYLTTFFVGFVAAIPIIWRVLKQYQRERIFSFINPHLDTSGAGYNAIQAMIAVGSGQLFGRGLGRGSQSQLRFLPERHTDFILASLTEELGFLGATIVLVSYFILLFGILRKIRESKDSFTRLFLFGVFIQIFLHVFINIGMNLGLLPITGITLPIMSYGGSSIIATSALLGLVQAAGIRSKRRTIAIG